MVEELYTISFFFYYFSVGIQVFAFQFPFHDINQCQVLAQPHVSSLCGWSMYYIR